MGLSELPLSGLHNNTPMEDNIHKKWMIPVVDPEVSQLIKTFTVLVDDVPVFKDPAYKNVPFKGIFFHGQCCSVTHLCIQERCLSFAVGNRYNEKTWSLLV